MANNLNLYDGGVFNGMINSNYEKYKEMFATKDTSTLGQSDFITLMVEQMKNQDISNPTDNTQFIAQMAQFSTLQVQQQVMELQKQMMYYSRASYATSLIGKEVTVARYDDKGNVLVDTGKVDSLQLVDGDFVFTVNGIEYTTDSIMTINSEKADNSGNDEGKDETPGDEGDNGTTTDPEPEPEVTE